MTFPFESDTIFDSFELDLLEDIEDNYGFLNKNEDGIKKLINKFYSKIWELSEEITYLEDNIEVLNKYLEHKKEF